MSFLLGFIIVPTLGILETVMRTIESNTTVDNFPEGEVIEGALFWVLIGLLITFAPPVTYVIYYVIKNRTSID